jgi:hypothetical protein
MFLFTLSLIITSCSKDDNNDARDNFLGTYGVNETFTLTVTSVAVTGTDTYDIIIAKSTTKANVILISNFANLYETAEATVSGNTFAINSQTVDDQSSVAGLSGSGSLSGTSLTISYILDGYWSGSCTCTKR